MQQQINSIISTINVAKKIKQELQKDSVIALTGLVGSGKSAFVKCLLQTYGFNYIGSPTFTLLNEYRSTKYHIVHLDLYNNPVSILHELLYYPNSIKIIEWMTEEVKKSFKPNMEIKFDFDGKYRFCEVFYY